MEKVVLNLDGLYNVNEAAMPSGEYSYRLSVGSSGEIKGTAKGKLDSSTKRLDLKESFSIDVDRSKPQSLRLQVHVFRAKMFGSAVKVATATLPLATLLEEGTVDGPFEMVLDTPDRPTTGGGGVLAAMLKGSLSCGESAEKLKRRRTIIEVNATGELAARAKALELANAELLRKLAEASVVVPPTAAESIDVLFAGDSVSQQAFRRLISRGHLHVSTILSSRSALDFYAIPTANRSGSKPEEVIAAVVTARYPSEAVDDDDSTDRFCLNNGQSVAITLVDDHLETILWRPSAAKILNDNGMATAAAFSSDRGTQTDDPGHIISVQLAGSPLHKVFTKYVQEKGDEEAAKVMQMAAVAIDQSSRNESTTLRKASTTMYQLMRSQDEVLTLQALLKKTEEEKDMLESRLRKRIRQLEDALAVTTNEL